MSIEVIFVLAIVFFMLVLLVATPLGTDTVLIGGLTMFLVSGIISPAEALIGLSNEGMVTVAVLYVVGAGVRETGGTDLIIHRILGRPRSLADGQLKLMAPVAALSAFLNNTPVVAIMIPAVLDWSRRFSLQASRLLIPLSYASMLGGTCTLIGTSTNLVVSGLVKSNTDLEPLGFFDIAWIGVPCTIVGLLFVVLFTRWLLPERTPPISCWETPREYTIEMVVEPEGPLVDKTVEEAGLRHLPGMFLAEIERGGHLLAAVSPQEPLEPNDRLVFAGLVDAVVDLQKIRGLIPATNQIVKLDSRRSDRLLVEAVVSDRCSLVGRSIREAGFRSRYNAVVIAVARHGERLKINIGDVVIRPGDTLLLEAQPAFVEQQRDSFDFFLISPIEGAVSPRHDRAFVAMAILAVLVVVVSMRWLSMLEAALLAGGAMIVTGCVNGTQARRSVDWQVLLTIAASFGIGQALVNTGAAGLIANSLIKLAGEDPWVTLAVVYILTSVFTSLITNNAAVVLLFPIAITAANDLQVNLLPFVMTIMVGASASFATPIGYQTNLMVYTAGGYRFSDFLRIGLPLNVVIGIVTVVLVPLIWRF
jgi:di/tricarboxylate transporter